MLGTLMKRRRVWIRIGVPARSVNCLDGVDFLAFVGPAAAMRVPNPAAGIIADTFIEGRSVYGSVHGSSITPPSLVQDLRLPLDVELAHFSQRDFGSADDFPARIALDKE